MHSASVTLTPATEEHFKLATGILENTIKVQN
jgi:hypothetical protein